MVCASGMTVAGCKRASPRDQERPLPHPSLPAPAKSRPAPSAPTATPRDAGPEIADATSDVFRGGNWVRCYGGFKPGDTPHLDAMRLGLMCGPSNGMRRLPASTFVANAGDCYRVVAAGAPGVQALEIDVVDAAGQRIATTTREARWAVLEPNGAFCVPGAGTYRVDVKVARGEGGTAVEVWRLR